MTDELPDDLRSVKTGVEFLDEYLDMPRIDLTEFIEEQVRLLNKDREIPIVIGPKPSKWQNDDDLDVDDLMVILACLEGKENNVDGRLDPRCPMENGRFVMNVVEMLDKISKIKENIKKKLG